MTPDQSSALVIRGIYNYSRNPMYLGFTLVLIGWGVLLSNMPALLSVAGFVWYLNRFQITPEENALRANFGQAFLDYEQTVRRWI